MKLIVGLGNPGKEYNLTRHNIGYIIIDEFAKKYNLSFSQKMNGLYAKGSYNGESYILLKPLSYMNLSGTVIKKYVDYYKIDFNDILIIHDDLDLPLGKIKLKSKGSCGGHNGIRNIIDNLNTESFARFKIGISNDKTIPTADYVLGKFKKKEIEVIEKIRNFSSDIILDFLLNDINKVMSKYNGGEYEIK